MENNNTIFENCPKCNRLLSSMEIKNNFCDECRLGEKNKESEKTDVQAENKKPIKTSDTYIQANLSENESILYLAKLHKILFFPALLLLLFSLLLFPSQSFGGAILFCLSVAAFIGSYSNFKSSQIGLTNSRVLAKYGVRPIKLIDLNLDKIENVSVDQNSLGKSFHFGTVILQGPENEKTLIKLVSDPLNFQSEIMAAIDKNKLEAKKLSEKAKADSDSNNNGQILQQNTSIENESLISEKIEQLALQKELGLLSAQEFEDKKNIIIE
jgi:hypothetical protein